MKMQGKVTGKRDKGVFIEGYQGFITYGNYYKGTRDFNVGDVVEYEVNVKGTFTNLKSLTVISQGATQPTTQNNTQPAPETAKQYRTSSDEIQRLALLKVAATVYTGLNPEPAMLAMYADSLTDYVKTGIVKVPAPMETAQ